MPSKFGTNLTNLKLNGRKSTKRKVFTFLDPVREGDANRQLDSLSRCMCKKLESSWTRMGRCKDVDRGFGVWGLGNFTGVQSRDLVYVCTELNPNLAQIQLTQSIIASSAKFPKSLKFFVWFLHPSPILSSTGKRLTPSGAGPNPDSISDTDTNGVAIVGETPNQVCHAMAHGSLIGDSLFKRNRIELGEDVDDELRTSKCARSC